MDEKELQKLYGAVSSKFDIGNFDEFKGKMSSAEDRKRFFDVVGKKGFDLGDYDTYENRISGIKKKEAPAQPSSNGSQGNSFRDIVDYSKAQPKITTPKGTSINIDESQIPAPARTATYLTDMQKRVSDGSSTAADLLTISKASGKRVEAVDAYLKGDNNRGQSIDRVETMKVRSGSIAKAVDDFNNNYADKPGDQTNFGGVLGYGAKFDPNEVLSNPDKASQFLQIYKAASDKKIGSRNTQVHAAAINGHESFAKTNQYFDDLQKSIEENNKILAEHISDKTVEEDVKKGVSRDETVKKIAQRINPKGYEYSEKAKTQGGFDNLSDKSSPGEILGAFKDLISGTKEKDDMLNSIKGTADIQYNNSVQKLAADKAAMANITGDENLMTDAKSLYDKYDPDILKKYPAIQQQQMAAELTDMFSKKTGNVEGEDTEDYSVKFFGVNKEDVYAAVKEKGWLDDPNKKELAMNLVAHPNLIGDASYFGGAYDNLVKPVKDLGLSIGDISGFRNLKDRYSDKLADQSFPTEVEQMKPFARGVRTAVNTTANLAGMTAIAVATGGIGRAAGIGLDAAEAATLAADGLSTEAGIGLASKAKAAQSSIEALSNAMSFGLPSVDQNLKDSYDFIDNDAARGTYAAMGAILNTYGGKLLDLPKLSSVPGLQSVFAKTALGITDNTLTEDAAKELLATGKNKYVDFAMKYGKNVTEGAAVMSYFTASNEILKSSFGDPNTPSSEILNKTGHAFLDGVLGMLVFGAVKAVGERNDNKNSSFKSTLYQMALTPDAAKDLFTINKTTDADYNKKIKVLNTAIVAKNALDAAQSELNLDLTPNQRAVYVANKTIENHLRERAATEVDEAAKSSMLNKADELNKQSKEIFEGLQFTPTLEPLHELFDAEKERDAALEEVKANPSAENEAKFEEAKQRFDGLSGKYLETGKTISSQKTAEDGKSNEAQEAGKETDAKGQNVGTSGVAKATPDFTGLSHVQSAGELLKIGVIDEAKHTELVKDLTGEDESKKDAAVNEVKSLKESAANISIPTIESAVIEINGKQYEGKNHAEAILKAKEDEQDISNIDRQAEGKFKLSDGSIITREEAKSRFGNDKSELIIPQDEAAKNADKDYEKIKSRKNKVDSEIDLKGKTSDDIYELSKKAREKQKAQEKEILGEDASAYNISQKTVNSGTASQENIDVAQKKIDEIESGLTEQQKDVIFGRGQISIEHEDLDRIAGKVAAIEQSENIEDLAKSSKKSLIDLANGRNQMGTEAVLDAVKRKAEELGIDTKDLTKAAINEAGLEFSDKQDAKDLLSKLFGKKEEDTKPSIPIEGTDEQGIPTGENVPPPTEQSSKDAVVDDVKRDPYEMSNNSSEEDPFFGTITESGIFGGIAYRSTSGISIRPGGMGEVLPFGKGYTFWDVYREGKGGNFRDLLKKKIDENGVVYTLSESSNDVINASKKLTQSNPEYTAVEIKSEYGDYFAIGKKNLLEKNENKGENTIPEEKTSATDDKLAKDSKEPEKKSEAPPETPKEPLDLSGMPPEKQWTAIRKSKLSEIESVKKMFEDGGAKKWSGVIESAMDNLQDRYPDKSLYEASRSRVNEFASYYDNKVPFNPTTEDLAVMQYFKAETENRISKIDGWDSADDIRRLAAITEFSALNNDLVAVSKAINPSEAGRAFGFRQSESMLDPQHGLQIRRTELLEAKGGDKLTDEDLEFTADQWDKERAIMMREAELKEKGMEESFNKQIDKLRNDYEEKIKALKGEKAPKAEVRKKMLSESGKELADRLRGGKISGTYATIPGFPQAVNLVIEAIAQIVEKGSTLAEAISQYVKEYSVKDENDFTDRLFGVLENRENRNDILSKIKENAELNKVTDVTKDMVAKGLVKDYINSHIGEFENKDILKVAAEGLRDVLPDITKEKLNEAYLKAGDFKQPTKQKLQSDFNDAKSRLEKLSKVEKDLTDLKEKKNLFKAGTTETTVKNTDKEIQKKEKELKKAMNDAGIKTSSEDKYARASYDSRAKMHNERLSDIGKKISDKIDAGVPDNELAMLNKLKGQLDAANVKLDENSKLSHAPVLDNGLSILKKVQQEFERGIKPDNILGLADIKKSLQRAVDQFGKDKSESEQDIKLQRLKDQYARDIEEYKRKINANEYNDNPVVELKKTDAELIKLERDRRYLQEVYQSKKKEYGKKKSYLLKGAEILRGFYVAGLIFRLGTATKVALTALIRPSVEAATKLSGGKLFDSTFSSVGKAAKGGGESNSLQSIKKSYEAQFAQYGAKGLEKKYAIANEKYEKSSDRYVYALNDFNKKYPDGQNTEGGRHFTYDKNNLQKLKNKMDNDLMAAVGNSIFQFIGGSSIKDSLSALQNRSNIIEKQFGGFEEDRFKGQSKTDKFNYILGYIGRSHSALKTFSGRASYAAGFMARLEGAISDGVDIADPNKIMEIANASYLDWERGKYQQSNFVTDAMNKVTQSLDHAFEDTKWDKYGKSAATLLRFDLPITRVPVNMLHEAVAEYTLGFFRGTYAAANEYRKARNEVKLNEELTPNTKEFRDAVRSTVSKMDANDAARIVRAFRKGFFGLGLYSLVATLGIMHYGGFYHKGQKKKKEEDLASGELNAGELLLGGENLGETMTKAIEHQSVLFPALLATDWLKVMKESVDKGETDWESARNASMSTLEVLQNDIPQTKMINPIGTAKNVYKSFFTSVGKAYSAFDVDEEGNPIERKPITFTDDLNLIFGRRKDVLTTDNYKEVVSIRNSYEKQMTQISNDKDLSHEEIVDKRNELKKEMEENIDDVYRKNKENE